MQSVMNKSEDRLKAKDHEIQMLKRKVKEWEARGKKQDLIHRDEMQKQKALTENFEYFYNRCLSLEGKIFEMEKFLADYGLVWVGESKTSTGKRLDVATNEFIKNCYNQLTTNIDALNMSVGKGEVHVQRSQDGGCASFKTPSCMCLRFYKNGMIIDKGKLRRYSDPTTGSFICDILDGYFPSELQKQYPNGVPFKVEDHRMETYMENDFPGHGYRLGKQSMMGTRPSTTSVESTIETTAQYSKSSPGTSEQRKQYRHKLNTTRPAEQTLDLKSSSLDLLGLRSHILASHNNNCSDTHLQSHMNAELGRSSSGSGRCEKKRIVATKKTEYQIAVNEKRVRSRDVRPVPSFLSTRSRSSRDSSAGRLASGFSSSRLGNSSSGMRLHTRSSSLTDGHCPLRGSSSLSHSCRKNNSSRNFFNSSTSEGIMKPRISRSATLDRKKDLPTIREINVPTGKPGEFRLKVRSIGGSTVFLVYVSADDPVARLYQLLDKTLLNGRGKDYKIVVSGYERKRLDQFNVSLHEYGITRDSVVHLVYK